MATDTYDINFNQFTKPAPGGSAGGIAGKAGASSSADSAMLTKLAKLITQLYKEQSKQTAKILESSVAKMIRTALSSAGAGIDTAEMNKMIKRMSKEVGDSVAKGALKSISGAVSKSPGNIGTGGIDETKLSKSISAGIDKSSVKQAKLLAAELRKHTGVAIDESALARAMSVAVKNAFPKTSETALKDFTQAAGSLKNLGRDISRLVQVIGSMRKSGGKIDLAEIGPVVSSLKVIFKDFQQLSSESKKAKESLKALGMESKETIRQLTKAIDDFKKSAGQTVSGVRQRAKDDPTKFSREMISAVSKAISKSSTLKDTEFAKVVKSLEGKQGDLSKLAKEFSKLHSTLSKQAKTGKVKIEGIEEVLREFGRISRSVGSLPTQMVGSNAPKEWEKSAKRIEKVLNKFADLTKEFNIVIKDKDLKTLEKLEKLQKMGPITIDVSVETKQIYNDVLNAVRSAIGEASKTKAKTKMEITPIAKDLIAAIEVGDLDKSISNLEKLVKRWPATLKTAAPQAELARKRVSNLKASTGGGWYATENPDKNRKIFQNTIKEQEKATGNALKKQREITEKITKDVGESGLGKSAKDASESLTTLSKSSEMAAKDVAALKNLKKVINTTNSL